jgi:hypothetical protein
MPGGIRREEKLQPLVGPRYDEPLKSLDYDFERLRSAVSMEFSSALLQRGQCPKNFIAVSGRLYSDEGFRHLTAWIDNEGVSRRYLHSVVIHD